ncbi:MAG: ArsR family transcriptional regulator [Chloroflexi bacterium]|nr:MAG: hypothetical protein CUN54_07725 [Phototrophicales bacterium]RMF81597.1 MAG: ArsR family transcriptional regulator [Chloroflexota bacterium]
MTPDDLLQTRFMYSPSVEILTSYFTLVNPHCTWIPQRWKDEAYRALYDVELPYLSVFVTPSWYAADLLIPSLDTSTPTLEDEIEQLLHLPNQAIQYEIECLLRCGATSPIIEHFLLEPRESIRRLARDMRVYWERVLKPQWPGIQAILEGDILYRARQIALNGTTSAFDDLHKCVYYEHERGYVQIDMACENTVQLDGSGLRLIPTTFYSTTGLYVQWDTVACGFPVIIYGARGRGLLPQAKSEQETSLEYALGTGRARVLQVLTTPSNTGEIARQLDVTAGAVSQHLQRLNQAGLVAPHRSGKRVFYHLTDRGEQLLMLFDRT